MTCKQEVIMSKSTIDMCSYYSYKITLPSYFRARRPEGLTVSILSSLLPICSRFIGRGGGGPIMGYNMVC